MFLIARKLPAIYILRKILCGKNTIIDQRELS